MSTSIALLTTSRAQARAIRLAQIEKEQQAEDAQALSLISSLSCELSDVNVPWADLDGLSWTGSHLRKASERKDRKARGMPYFGVKGSLVGKEGGGGGARRVLSERIEKLVGAAVPMKPSTSAPGLAFGEITNTTTADVQDKIQTIRATHDIGTIRAPDVANILAQSRVATPTITPPLVVRKSSSSSSSYIERLIESRERSRGRGRSPVKAIFNEADMKMRDRVISRAEKVPMPMPEYKDEQEPEQEPEQPILSEYTAGTELFRTPSYSYRSDPVEVEDDMQTPTPGMFRGTGYFSTKTTSSTILETDLDGEATIRLPPAKKSRPLPLPPPLENVVFLSESNTSFLASVGASTFPLSAPLANTAFPLTSPAEPTAAFPLSDTAIVMAAAPRRARAKTTSGSETKPPISLLNPTVNLKRGKTLSLVGPRPMLERRPTPVPGVEVVGGGKRKRS